MRERIACFMVTPEESLLAELVCRVWETMDEAVFIHDGSQLLTVLIWFVTTDRSSSSEAVIETLHEIDRIPRKKVDFLSDRSFKSLRVQRWITRALLGRGLGECQDGKQLPLLIHSHL